MRLSGQLVMRLRPGCMATWCPCDHDSQSDALIAAQKLDVILVCLFRGFDISLLPSTLSLRVVVLSKLVGDAHALANAPYALPANRELQIPRCGAMRKALRQLYTVLTSPWHAAQLSCLGTAVRRLQVELAVQSRCSCCPFRSART